MSGEKAEDRSGWTLDTLYAMLQRQHDDLGSRLQERFESQQAALSAADKLKDQRFADIWREFGDHLLQVREETRVAFIASEKAIAKAEQSMEKRLDQMNEFRDQLRDQAATFMPRVEYDSRHAALSDRVDATDAAMTDKVDTLERRMSERSDNVRNQLSKDIEAGEVKILALGQRMDLRDGELAGAAGNYSRLIAFITVGVAVLTFVILVSNHVI